ncbi:hypothetical protein ACC702_38635, partial [Rhizobium ruizarguesonis]
LSAIIAIISIVGLMIQDRALRGRDYLVIGFSGASAAFELGAWRFVFTPLFWTILFFELMESADHRLQADGEERGEIGDQDDPDRAVKRD